MKNDNGYFSYVGDPVTGLTDGGAAAPAAEEPAPAPKKSKK